MFDKISDFPRRIWDGLKNLSPMSRYKREEGQDPTPTGEDFSAVCTEIIAIENGCCDLHEYITRVDDSLTATKDDLEKQIQEVSQQVATVEKLEGPPGKDGESIQGPPGKDGESIQGPPGESIQGPPGLNAPIPEFVWDNDILKIIIDDKTILSPHLKGPTGKSVPAKRIPGLGGGMSSEGPRGLKGEKGDSGGGAIVLSCEASEDIALGQPIRILATTKAALALDGSCLGLALTSALTGHAVQWVGDGNLVSQPDWSAIVGSTNLTPGATYFLDSPGKLTTAVPSTGWIYKIGYAVNNVDFLIEFSPPIKL